MTFQILATICVLLLVVMGSHTEWPDPKEGWARIALALIILAVVWF